MYVIGIDPSLTGTGVALIPLHDAPTTVTTIKSKPSGRSVTAMVERMNHIMREFSDIVITVDVLQTGVALAVIEAPARSQNTGMSHERGGLWWRIATLVDLYGMPILSVAPNLRTKYATGSGRSGKDEVMLAAAKRYPDMSVANNNEADAVLLAAMGARLLGQPIEPPLPQANLAAMKTLSLPT